jgi:hypothetical protein
VTSRLVCTDRTPEMRAAALVPLDCWARTASTAPTANTTASKHRIGSFMNFIGSTEWVDAMPPFQTAGTISWTP